MIRACLIALTLAASVAFANTPAKPEQKDFSSWRKFTTGKLIAETTAIPPGSAGKIGFYVTLADKWHTYWVNPGDSGAALRLDFRNGPGVKVNRVDMPKPERFESGPLISFAYAKEVLFPIEIEIDSKVVPGSTAKIEVDAEWLVCDEVCLPAVDTFTLEVPVAQFSSVKPTENFPLFQRFIRNLPKQVATSLQFKDGDKDSTLEIPVWTPNREFIDFFPFRGSGVNNKKPAATGAVPLVLTFQKSSAPRAGPERLGVLISRDTTTGTIEAWQFGDPQWSFSQTETALKSAVPLKEILWMLVSAFLGGLILNLMPCVFPILSIKILALLKVGKARQTEIRKQNLGYTAGVMVSFLAIALVLSALRSAGDLVGWGFQLQSALFLTFLCWLFFALTLNLAGLFEIDFLDSGVGGKFTKLGGVWGSFFTGVLAVVVASPCTAPFMGVALGFGLTQPAPLLIAVFLTLGFGLAFPYFLLAIFPAALSIMPKPGAWMVRVKQFMAVPMLATVVWLTWVLQQVAGSFTIGVVMVGCGLILVTVFLNKPKKVAGTLTLAVLLTMMGYIHVRTSAPKPVGSVKVQTGPWRAYTPELLTSLKEQNVFVNMTADWCLTCKVNEKLVFDEPEILELLKAKNVVMVQGDWTQKNGDITRFLAKYNRVGVPFYVLYSPRNPIGTVLPEVLTKSSFKDWIEKEFP